jgi:uncharacterized membrane protein YoaK (UPF0700 family)
LSDPALAAVTASSPASHAGAGHGAGPPTSIRHPLVASLLALTFTTGLIDAASYLGFDHVFSANMTGNVVLLGFGIGGAKGLPVVAPAVSMAAFVAGAGAGGMLAAALGQRQVANIGWALTIEAVLVAAATLLVAIVDVRPNAPSGDAVIALLAFAMGLRNATVRRLGVPDLTTTVLTMTLTGLAAESRLFGGTGKGSVRRIAAVIAMLAGAVAGALLLKAGHWLPLACACGVAILIWIAYLPARIRPAQGADASVR